MGAPRQVFTYIGLLIRKWLVYVPIVCIMTALAIGEHLAKKNLGALPYVGLLLLTYVVTAFLVWRDADIAEKARKTKFADFVRMGGIIQHQFSMGSDQQTHLIHYQAFLQWLVDVQTELQKAGFHTDAATFGRIVNAAPPLEQQSKYAYLPTWKRYHAAQLAAGSKTLEEILARHKI